ncbi:MAG TPA: mechanosensitive ion channel domain-containing protein [Magnetospirillum sp.]|nr:mechanosensitive ion channel domain-containing protein [Magnetospirillum sp.]
MIDTLAASLPQLSELAIRWGSNVTWALVTLIFGWVLAGWAERAIKSGLARVRMGDQMLRGFFGSLARWALLAVTGVAVLERLGVQTTSVVAIMGAAGLAIGLALQGTLSNLAAGVMLLLFRPFKVGDGIEGGGLAGTVKEVSLFHSHLVTGDNIQVIAPNAMLWNAALRNLSFYASRKVEIVAPVPYAAGADQTLNRIRELVTADSRIAADPAPAVMLTKFGEKAAEITVSVWCATGSAAAVKSDLMTAIWRECTLGAA